MIKTKVQEIVLTTLFATTSPIASINSPLGGSYGLVDSVNQAYIEQHTLHSKIIYKKVEEPKSVDSLINQELGVMLNPMVNKKQKTSLKTQIKKQPKKEEVPKVTIYLTFYTDLPSENGGYTITCYGDKLTDGIVASNHYPRGTKIIARGWGELEVQDKGSKIFNSPHKLDVFVPRENGESDDQYLNRVNNMGRIKVQAEIVYPKKK